MDAQCRFLAFKASQSRAGRPEKTQIHPCFPTPARRRFARPEIALPQIYLWCWKAKSLDRLLQKKSPLFPFSFQRYSAFKTDFRSKILQISHLSAPNFSPSRPICPKLRPRLPLPFPFQQQFFPQGCADGKPLIPTLFPHQQTRKTQKGYKAEEKGAYFRVRNEEFPSKRKNLKSELQSTLRKS